MASITERKGRFLVRVRKDGFATVAKTFTRKADGAAWARRVEADMEAGRWIDPSRRVPTLKQAIAEYRVTVASRMKGADTYTYRFDEFESVGFASKPIDEVTTFDLASWRDGQLSRLKPGTVVRKLALLSGVFTWCVKERGWLNRNPLSLVRKPRVSDSRDRTLSAAEIDYLMAAARSSKATWLAAALKLLMCSAMRRSELFGLRRRDVDYAAATAHLRDTKNGTARNVPLCPQALSALRQLDAAAERQAGITFLPIGAVGSMSTRFVKTVERARRAYARDCATKGQACDDSFLADLRLHDLRHHAVTEWATTGALSLVELMSISGHKTARMLTRYTHLSAATIASKLAGLKLHRLDQRATPSALTAQLPRGEQA